MTLIPAGHEAAFLSAWMRSAGEAGTLAYAERVVEKAKGYAPPTPEDDRHPEYHLREAFEILPFGRVVSIENNLPYAVKQHEALHFHHPNGGGAKFLERAVWDTVGEWKGLLEVAVRTQEIGTGRVRTHRRPFQQVSGYTRRSGVQVRPYARRPRGVR